MRRRDAVARAIYPEFDETYRLKMTLPSDILNKDSLNFFTLTIVDPQGRLQEHASEQRSRPEASSPPPPPNTESG